MSSRSSVTDVLPSPGATLALLKTFVEKPLSLATSNVYVRGRTPLVVAFWMMSLMGCSDSLYLKPWAGSSRTGAEIVTPSMGPATVGARGDELFAVWQPVKARTSRPHETVCVRDVMANLEGPERTLDRGVQTWAHTGKSGCFQPIGRSQNQL